MKRYLLLLPLAFAIACASDDNKDTTNTAGKSGTAGNTKSNVAGTGGSAAGAPGSVAGAPGGTAGAPGATCTTTTANNAGVGKPCTKGGNECKVNNMQSVTCVADVDSKAPAPFFCTKNCTAGGNECGTDATCCLVNKAANIYSCAPSNCGCPANP